MVRGERLSGRLALLTVVLAVGAGGVLGAGCKKRKPAGPPAIERIKASEPNQRARALRDQMRALTKAGKLEQAAALWASLAKAVSDLLGAMDTLHFKKTAVPDFAVVRYVEALRDLGRNLRGFDRLWSPKNPKKLQREMLHSLLDQLDRKIR